MPNSYHMLLSDFSIMYKASTNIAKGQRITRCFGDVMTGRWTNPWKPRLRHGNTSWLLSLIQYFQPPSSVGKRLRTRWCLCADAKGVGTQRNWGPTSEALSVLHAQTLTQSQEMGRKKESYSLQAGRLYSKLNLWNQHLETTRYFTKVGSHGF